MKAGILNIGLSYYQEEQWKSALKLHGANIMDKSLLSRDQKDALIKAAGGVIVEPGIVEAIDGKKYYNTMRIIAL